MRRKGFTLVELLVVIAIIALLMGILMPALARVRHIAFRLVCGTNVSGIGKAMLVYSNDYEDELPRAGGPRTTWGAPGSVQWAANTRGQAYFSSNQDGVATITSCFYLLVKYADVTPKSFICRSDSEASEFRPAEEAPGREAIELWDFGAEPLRRCSYSYHLPFYSATTQKSFALTTSGEPGMALVADRNPWIKDASGTKKDFAAFTNRTSRDGLKMGNALAHQDEGQNVLFLDGHVEFMKSSLCGVNDDNIFTWMDASWKGGQPMVNPNAPQTRQDSYLVHDGGETIPSNPIPGR